MSEAMAKDGHLFRSPQSILKEQRLETLQALKNALLDSADSGV